MLGKSLHSNLLFSLLRYVGVKRHLDTGSVFASKKIILSNLEVIMFDAPMKDLHLLWSSSTIPPFLTPHSSAISVGTLLVLDTL